MIEKSEVEAFIFKEARLADEYYYDEWENLWTEDGNYWVPANGDDYDTHRKVSIINDNRERIRTRVKRMKSNVAHSQEPKSRLVRVISNIEVAALDEEEAVVSSTFYLAEARPYRETIWAGRTTHRLVREDGKLKMRQKKVMLANNGNALVTLGFLI